MTVGLQYKNIITEIGTSDFLQAFFATISVRLEPDGWGSRFPILLTTLYRGEITDVDAEEGLRELHCIKDELRHFKPDQVIWDIDNREKMPPWGTNVSPDITDLSNYFVTSGGKDVFEIFEEELIALQEGGGVLKIIPL